MRGTVKSDNGMPTPTIKLAISPSKLNSLATTAEVIIGAIPDSRTVTWTIRSSPVQTLRYKSENIVGAKRSLKPSP